MEGEVVIDFQTGWACSNEAQFTEERDLVQMPDLTWASKHTPVIRVMYYKEVVGKIEKNNSVNCVFKNYNGEKKGYEAVVTGITDEMIVLTIQSEIGNIKNIIKKIGGYNHGK